MNRAMDVIRRASIGAVAGAIAGVGLILTWRSRWLPFDCFEGSELLCGGWLDANLLVFTASWATVAGLLLSATLVLLKRPRAWMASRLGCAGWLVLWVPAAVLGLTPDRFDLTVVLIAVFALGGALSVPRTEFADDE